MKDADRKTVVAVVSTTAATRLLRQGWHSGRSSGVRTQTVFREFTSQEAALCAAQKLGHPLWALEESYP